MRPDAHDPGRAAIAAPGCFAAFLVRQSGAPPLRRSLQGLPGFRGTAVPGRAVIAPAGCCAGFLERRTGGTSARPFLPPEPSPLTPLGSGEAPAFRSPAFPGIFSAQGALQRTLWDRKTLKLLRAHMAVWPRADLRAVTGMGRHPIASSSFIGGACRERHVLPAPTADQAPSPAADQRSDLTKRGRARDPLRSPIAQATPSAIPGPVAGLCTGGPPRCVWRLDRLWTAPQTP